jgi:hypothetical protein
MVNSSYTSPLMFDPRLAVAIGLNEAIVVGALQRMEVGAKPDAQGHRWVRCSVEQWRQEFPFWSPETIARALKSLRTRGLVVAERRSDDAFDRALSYRIDPQAVDVHDTVNLTYTGVSKVVKGQ